MLNKLKRSNKNIKAISKNYYTSNATWNKWAKCLYLKRIDYSLDLLGNLEYYEKFEK